MTPLRSIVMWAAAICAVMFMLFVGYSIAAHDTGPLVIGAVLLCISAALVVAQGKLARD